MINKSDNTRDMLNIVRNKIVENKVANAINKRKKLIKEDKEKKKDYIAITNDVIFGNNVLQTQIDAFKASVNPGAKFSKEDSNEPETNPLIYLPETGNLVFSGSIPNLGNMKFQFSLMDVTNAPYIWTEGLPLTDEVVNTINKMKAFYLNWKEQWLLREDLLEKLDGKR